MIRQMVIQGGSAITPILVPMQPRTYRLISATITYVSTAAIGVPRITALDVIYAGIVNVWLAMNPAAPGDAEQAFLNWHGDTYSADIFDATSATHYASAPVPHFAITPQMQPRIVTVSADLADTLTSLSILIEDL
jgi:hypothetical protein